VPNKLTDDVVSVSPDLKHKIATATNTLQAGHPGAEIPETDILNFALNLEYLEAEFYTYASTGKSISSFGVGIDGVATGENPQAGGSTFAKPTSTAISDKTLYFEDKVLGVKYFVQNCHLV
jgi:hypothetical protein